MEFYLEWSKVQEAGCGRMEPNVRIFNLFKLYWDCWGEEIVKINYQAKALINKWMIENCLHKQIKSLVNNLLIKQWLLNRIIHAQ